MKHKTLWTLLSMMAVLSLALAACGGQPAAPTGGEESSAPAAEIVTSSGFVCPLPEFEGEVTSKELNLFVWTEYIPTDMVECFELVYGVQVNLDEYSSNEEMFAKLAAGGTSYDMAQPTDYIVPLMVRSDMLQEIDKSRFLALKNIDPNYLGFDFDPENTHSIPYQAGTDALIYNADTVTTPPTSWADLWNPEYAGRMVFLDDSRAVIGFTLVTLGYDPNTTNPAELEEAKAKLAELIPNVKLFDSDSPKTALIAGDVDLGMTWTGEAFLANQENPAITYVYPTEGAVLWQDNWVILKDAGNLDAVYAWLNYTNQGNIFWMMLRDFPYTNPNSAALAFAKDNHPELYDAYINSPVTNTPAEAIANGWRVEDVGEATPLYDQVWTEIKGGE